MSFRKNLLTFFDIHISIMKSKNEISSEKEIDKKLDSIQRDIKLIMEKSNQQYLDLMMSNLKKDIMHSISSYLSEDVESHLEKGMVEKCPMRDTCKLKFSTILNRNAGLIYEDEVDEENISANSFEIEELQNNAPFEKCDICFSEVSNTFQKQVNLIRSMQIYENHDNNKKDISQIDEHFLVKDILEPLSHKQRIQIMKSMATSSKTFSTLSEITGLRGGNLLYHIQKLLDSDLIIQRHERGDYMITEKGYKIMSLLLELNL